MAVAESVAHQADSFVRSPHLSGVTPEMRLYSEESFGPVVAVMPVEGPDEAVRVANDSDYGLAAAVFSEDVPAALEEFTELRWITVQSLGRQYPI